MSSLWPNGTFNQPAETQPTNALARPVDLKRPGLSKVFSKKGNPTLQTLQATLEALDLRLAVASAKGA